MYDNDKIYKNICMIMIYIYTLFEKYPPKQPQCLQAACGVTFISLLALGELHYATTPNKGE